VATPARHPRPPSVIIRVIPWPPQHAPLLKNLRDLRALRGEPLRVTTADHFD
jgi:hypothetical protein